MRLIRSLTGIATLLTFGVILLGSFTRLTDAGLGCPDWPGCYGFLTVPQTPEALSEAQSLFHQEVHATKAWTEMIHRYAAGLLGLLIATIFGLSLKKRKTNKNTSPLPSILLALVIFQALLGMWTVTLKLLPLVVMAHLLGGFATLSLLFLFWRQLSTQKPHPASVPRALLNTALVMLIAQIILGAWTSTNYAALICTHFPQCDNEWWPSFSWHAFNFTAGLGLSNPLTAMTTPDRITIHMLHRLGAVLTTGIISALIAYLYFVPKRARQAAPLLLLLLLQITLGTLNVLYKLPLFVAVAHTGTAALLLLTIINLYTYGKKSHAA